MIPDDPVTPMAKLKKRGFTAAANAGPSFQLVNINGKFHGTMEPTTPSGPRCT